jgi:hypothetical protein
MTESKRTVYYTCAMEITLTWTPTINEDEIFTRDKREREFTAGTTRQKHHTYATEERPVYKIHLNTSPHSKQYLHIINHVGLPIL